MSFSSILQVNADYTHLSEISVVVRNFTVALTKDITFELSTPLENSNGVVLSDLPYFEKGLPLLAPREGFSRCWGRLPALAPTQKDEGGTKRA